MNASDILLLTDYNRWANTRLLEAVEKLTPEAFSRKLGSSFSSIRETLVHILGGEWIWFMRWKGISPKSMLAAEDFPDLHSVRQKWVELEMDRRNFLSKISDESLQEMVEYQNLQDQTWEYKLWQMVQQVVNHSTYHRGQVVSMLRQIGAETTSLDFLVYLDTKETA